MNNILNNINCILSEAYDKPYEMNSLSENKLMELLNDDYSEAYKSALNGSIIYRGMSRGKPDFFLATPRKRISQNTSNVYTLLMSEMLSSWKNYPKRNESFICTLSEEISEDYGESYMILPINNTKIGICPDNDIWSSFAKVNIKLGEMHDFNMFLLDLLSNIGDIEFTTIVDYFKYGSLNNIHNLFKQVNEYFRSNKHKETSGWINTRLKNNKLYCLIIDTIKNFENFDLLLFLDQLLNPKINNFYLTNIKSLSTDIRKFDFQNNECWLSAPAIMIKYDAFWKIINQDDRYGVEKK